MRCAHQACSLVRSGDDQERAKMSGIFRGRTLSRCAPEGCGILELTRWRSCLSSCRMGADAR